MRDEAAPDGAPPESDTGAAGGAGTESGHETGSETGSETGAAADVARLREENASLQVALGSNRFIGAAVGIIMITKYLTYDAAFEYLRALSQRSNRKIRELADQIVMTGEVPPMPSD